MSQETRLLLRITSPTPAVCLAQILKLLIKEHADVSAIESGNDSTLRLRPRQGSQGFPCKDGDDWKSRFSSSALGLRDEVDPFATP